MGALRFLGKLGRRRRKAKQEEKAAKAKMSLRRGCDSSPSPPSFSFWTRGYILYIPELRAGIIIGAEPASAGAAHPLRKGGTGGQV